MARLPARVNQHRSSRPRIQAIVVGRKGSCQAGSGGTRNALTQDDRIAYVQARWTISEQRAIAHILGTLDDKIELNRRMNETLEEMARALFKSWFVDFDPVRAKMEGTGYRAAAGCCRSLS